MHLKADVLNITQNKNYRPSIHTWRHPKKHYISDAYSKEKYWNWSKFRCKFSLRTFPKYYLNLGCTLLKLLTPKSVNEICKLTSPLPAGSFRKGNSAMMEEAIAFFMSGPGLMTRNIEIVVKLKMIHLKYCMCCGWPSSQWSLLLRCICIKNLAF